jgi:MFS transporter, MHS family, proline/betaine transporter
MQLKRGFMNLKIFRSSIFATIIGNSLEWFDYALIGYIAPRYINLYPSEAAIINPLFFIYSIALIGRPIGGLLFGYLGDILGRRLILILSISLMATGTLFAALLPSLFSFSILTPMLLLLILLFHNISAGGETAGTVVYLYESFPKKMRPFALSWVNFGFFLGVFFSTIDFSSLFWELQKEQFLDWGWRLPFVFSALIGFGGLAFRRKLHETPRFLEMKSHHELLKKPFQMLLKNYKKEILIGTGLLFCHTISINTLVIFGPSYFQTYLNRTPDETLTLCIFAMMIGMLSTAFSGYISLKIDAFRFSKLITAALAILAIPLFTLMQSAEIVPLFIAYALLTFLSSAYSAVMPTFICDLFPSKMMCSGYSLCRNFPIAFLTAVIPLLLSWMISAKGIILSPAYLIVLGAILSLVSLLAAEKLQAKKDVKAPI